MMDEEYSPVEVKSNTTSLIEPCPDCKCHEKPEKIPFKQWYRSLSRVSSARWRYIESLSEHIQFKVNYWFTKLRLVIWFKTTFPGGQAGVITGVVISILVLITNVIFLILATTQEHWGPDGLGTLVRGDCHRIDKLNKLAHGFINVMSTLLLMQSNYCMQLLASPTRSDIDAAHRKRQWVEIGIQSFRNVWKRHISPWRGLLWTVFAISSVPLHLLWNSFIIFSPSAFQYNQLTVTEDFIVGHSFTYPQKAYVYLENDAVPGTAWPDNLFLLQQDLSNYETHDGYEKLTNVECKRAYAQSFVRDRSDVIVVATPTAKGNDSTILGASSGGWGSWPYKWLCPLDSATNFKCYDQIRRANSTWTIGRSPPLKVDYCISKKMGAQCKLEYGFWIGISTVIANAIKTVCFLLTLRIMKNHARDQKVNKPTSERGAKLLITTGDAIASFLEFPDLETLGMSTVEKQDFTNGIWNLRWIPIHPMLWRQRYECSWFRAIGLRRWMLGMIPMAALPLIPSFFLLSKLTWLIQDIGLTQSAISQLGIGNPSGLFLLGSKASDDQLLTYKLLGNVALANTPQLLISVAYYLWNNHLVAMIAASEYDKYAAPVINSDGCLSQGGKRSLRVTTPEKGSEQTSTRFFAMPVSFWLANSVLWTLLHYLASQAVFYARVDVLDHWQQVTSWSISQVGYSVLGLIYFLLCAYFVLIYTITISLRRLPNRMPLAATCSGAISAACHPRNMEIKHHERKVQWGVELIDAELSVNEKANEMVPHCTFTSGEALYPNTGRYYA